MWGEGTNAHGPRMVRRTMDQHILSIEMRAVTKAVDRYLGESMPQTARETTGGNAHIIMFLRVTAAVRYTSTPSNRNSASPGPPPRVCWP